MNEIIVDHFEQWIRCEFGDWLRPRRCPPIYSPLHSTEGTVTTQFENDFRADHYRGSLCTLELVNKNPVVIQSYGTIFEVHSRCGRYTNAGHREDWKTSGSILIIDIANPKSDLCCVYEMIYQILLDYCRNMRRTAIKKKHKGLKQDANALIERIRDSRRTWLLNGKPIE
jgi:hypothetical protein